MPTSKTASSTPRLSELARHVVYPDDIVTTAWPRIEAKCAEMGVTFDPWQQGVGTLALGKRADGKYAATVGGVILSIPRQIGKTFLVGMILIALCVLFPDMTVLWTAHRTRTATLTFQSMAAMAKRKKIRHHLAPGPNEGIRSTNGEQEIRFRNGSVIMFGAREAGFGRGFDEVDVEVFDEAQILSESAIDNMVPAVNQSRQSAGGLLFFMGTPPKPGDNGEEFSRRRQRALDGLSKNAVFVEFSADEGADPDDHKQWRKANPSFPARTPVESMERMREQLGDDSFMREALGIWDEIAASAASVIESDEWDKLTIDRADIPADGRLFYGVKFSPDGLSVALSVALRGEVKVHVEGLDHRDMLEGTKWLVDWFATRWQKCGLIVIDGRSGAAGLVKALERKGVPSRKILVPNVDQAIAAHSLIFDAVKQQTVTHIADEVLAASVGSAGRRAIGKAGGWGFEPIDDGDVTLIESVALAHYAAVTSKTSKPVGTRGRRAVSL